MDQPSQDGLRRASSTNAGSFLAGRLTQASNAAQSFAGMLTTVLLSTSVSAEFQCLAANELAEAGVALLRRRFQHGALSGIDPNAEDRRCR